MNPIVVCVPALKPSSEHLDHFLGFYAANKERHNLYLLRLWYKPLHKVQRMAVSLAERVKASHILFTEDDQWGYPVDGLEVLLAEQKDVIGFHTYKKNYPYYSMAMRKRNADISMLEWERNLIPCERGGGPLVQEFDLISWGFTLVRLEVFERMREAKKDPFECWGAHPTDSYFCQYCEDIGVSRWIHFGCTIGHGPVPPKDIWAYRRMHDAIKSARNGFPYDKADDDDLDNQVLFGDVRQRLIEEYRPEWAKEGKHASAAD